MFDIPVSTLDIVFFRGSDFVSKIIVNVQKDYVADGSFSHVGIVVTKELLPWNNNMYNNKLYVWESTSSFTFKGLLDNIPAIDGKPHFGVQIRDLEEVVKSYTKDGTSKVSIGKLKNNPWLDEKNRPNVIKDFTYLYEKYGDAVYNYNCCDLFSSILPKLKCYRDWRVIKHKLVFDDKPIYGDDNKEYVYCSQLITIILKRIGIINTQNIQSIDLCPTELLPYCDDLINISTNNIIEKYTTLV